jgi:quercetin dioxygenase-like cupin family protein
MRLRCRRIGLATNSIDLASRLRLDGRVRNSLFQQFLETQMLRLCAVFFVLFVSNAFAQTTRNELKRADVTGTDMEVNISVVEVNPGDSLARHTHHGEEAVYALEGASLVLPDGKQVQFPTGAAVINQRDVAHAGFKVGGDKPLKMLTVHIVDKGKPLTEPPK